MGSKSARRLRCPIWDRANGNGQNGYYHIIGYVGFEIVHIKGGKDIEGVIRVKGSTGAQVLDAPDPKLLDSTAAASVSSGPEPGVGPVAQWPRHHRALRLTLRATSYDWQFLPGGRQDVHGRRHGRLSVEEVAAVAAPLVSPRSALPPAGGA